MAPAERRGRWYALVWCLIATVTATACSRDRRVTDIPVGSAPVAVAVRGDAAAMAVALGRGVNLGNILEAPRDGVWGLQLSDALFDAARAAGVRAIRLPVRWSAHAGATRPFTIDRAFMARVDYAVDSALSRGCQIPCARPRGGERRGSARCGWVSSGHTARRRTHHV